MCYLQIKETLLSDSIRNTYISLKYLIDLSTVGTNKLSLTVIMRVCFSSQIGLKQDSFGNILNMKPAWKYKQLFQTILTRKCLYSSISPFLITVRKGPPRKIPTSGNRWCVWKRTIIYIFLMNNIDKKDKKTKWKIIIIYINMHQILK